MATAMHVEQTRSINHPPCFNYLYFYGIGQVTLNDQMADLLSSALQRSAYKTPMLEELAKDLIGNTSEVEFDDSKDDVPSYAYTYLRNAGTLLINKAATSDLIEAIAESGCGRSILPPLWGLKCKLESRFAPKEVA